MIGDNIISMRNENPGLDIFDHYDMLATVIKLPL